MTGLRARLRRLRTRAARGWATTPGQLRAGRALLVVLILVSGGLGAVVAEARAAAARDVATRRERASSAVTEAYRDLADANVTAAAGFLPGLPPSPADRRRFEVDIERATASLATAAAHSRGGDLDLDRISDITAALATYTALVEGARVGSRFGSSGGSEMERASDLMQSTILRRVEALQRDQTKQLAAQYDRATDPPLLPAGLAAGVVTLLALVLAQVWLFHRTRRIVNAGLAAATALIVGLALWWSAAHSISHNHLDSSRRHSRSVTDALGQAQIAARQARTSEILAVAAGPERASSHHERFAARMLRLGRERGTGGALGAARHLTSTAGGAALVQRSIDQAARWDEAHGQLRRLRDEGRHREAVALAAGPAAEAFDKLDQTLAQAVVHERDAFREDITAAQRALRGLAAGGVVLAVAAAVSAARGIGTRLEEYR